jgi:hypothetical protein
MLQLAGVRARIDRLDELVRGLGKEGTKWKDGGWPADLSPERQQYVAALRRALEALGEARRALAAAPP